jgi:hypothetical protein
LVAAGVAVAVAALLGAFGGGRVAADLAVRRALTRLPPTERAVRAGLFGLPPDVWSPAIDARARRALAALTPEAPAVAILLKRTIVGGRLLQLGAVGDPRRWIRIDSGRLPSACTPARCEVVELNGRRAPAVVRAPGLHLVLVGRGTLRSPLPFGGTATPRQAGDSSVTPAFLVAGDPGGFSRLPGLGFLYRSDLWTAPLAVDRLHARDVEALLTREARAAAALEAGDDRFGLTGPDQVLRDAERRARAAARRMLVAGGEAAALLLAFVLLAGLGLGRDLRAERARLARRGATRGQVAALTVAEAGAGTLAGAVAGLVLAVAAVAVIGARAGVGAGDAVGHSVLTPTGIGLTLAAWAAATAALLIGQSVDPDAPARSRIGALDVLALAAIGALALAAARGVADPARLADGGVDPLLPLLPPLVCLVGGVAVARLLAPTLRLLERLARRGPAGIRLALLGLARSPRRAALTAAVIAVSLGLALFAQGYRATLSGGQRDEAAFAVPLDVTLREGSALVRPVDAAPLSRYRALTGGGVALPVLRASATVAASGTSPTPVEALGVPASGLPRLRWRSDYAAASPSALAARLEAGGPQRAAGPTIPADAVRLALPASTRGGAVTLGLEVETRRGTYVAVPLGAPSGVRRSLVAQLPPGAAGGRLAGLTVALSDAAAHATLHGIGEGDSAAGAVAGDLRLGPLRASRGDGGRRVVTRFAGWLPRNGLRLGAGPGDVRYAVSPEANALLRPRQPIDDRPVPVLATPGPARAAGPGGALELALGDRSVPATVVGDLRRFPATSALVPDAVVADEGALAAALNADAPGTAVPGEVWLAAGPHRPASALRAALARPPFDRLQRASYAGALADLRSDPLGRGIVDALGAAALCALALAVVGLALTAAATVRDERAELADLEAQGVAPRSLRAQLRLRAAIIGLAGALGGLAIGWALTRVVVALVTVGAGATSTRPPLVARIDVPSVILGAVALAGIAALAVALATRRALSAPGESR